MSNQCGHGYSSPSWCPKCKQPKTEMVIQGEALIDVLVDSGPDIVGTVLRTADDDLGAKPAPSIFRPKMASKGNSLLTLKADLSENCAGYVWSERVVELIQQSPRYLHPAFEKPLYKAVERWGRAVDAGNLSLEGAVQGWAKEPVSVPRSFRVMLSTKFAARCGYAGCGGTLVKGAPSIRSNQPGGGGQFKWMCLECGLLQLFSCLVSLHLDGQGVLWEGPRIIPDIAAAALYQLSFRAESSSSGAYTYWKGSE